MSIIDRKLEMTNSGDSVSVSSLLHSVCRGHLAVQGRGNPGSRSVRVQHAGTQPSCLWSKRDAGARRAFSGARCTDRVASETRGTQG